MKEHLLKIRIVPIQTDNEKLNSKYSFWKYISNRTDKENNVPENLEYIFKKNFAKELKNDLKQKFRNELNEFERNYNIDFNSPYLDELLYFYFRKLEKYERIHFDDFINSISKLQELKNDYLKNNKEYQKLLEKYLIASQIDFGIKNISYSSLGFDLSIEPFDKVVRVFDNNYELFRIFLDQYIPESFFSSISLYNSNVPIDVIINNSETLIDAFNKKPDNKENMEAENVSKNNRQQSEKWEKAKWFWSMANGSLVVPVILALLILYFAFNKIESVNSIRQDNFEKIQIENNKVIENYHKLIEIQDKTYNELINKVKKDTIK